MATLKFKKESPYQCPKTAPPKVDYIYDKFQNNFSPKKLHENDVVGVALFGAGNAGAFHLEFLARSRVVKLLYIVEDLQEKWTLIREAWNLNDTVFLTSKDAAATFKDVKVHAIVVATPTKTHAAIVLEALDNQKAVFCEKPISQDFEKTRECYRKAKEANQLLLCGYNRRFDPSFNSVRERVWKGEVGHLHMVKTCSRDSPMPSIEYLKVSGGIFHDCAIHDLDVVIWIVGEYPCKVSVSATANIPEIAEINDYDTVAIVLTFPSGTIGIIDLSRNSIYGYDQRLEVFGSKGMMKVDNLRPIHGVETSLDLNGPRHAPIWYSFPSRYREGYDREMEHFLNALRGLEKPKVHGNDVSAVSRIASACGESARTGTPVLLEWSKDELPANEV